MSAKRNPSCRAAALSGIIILSAAQGNAYTERMPYEQSSAIKRSMLPPNGSMKDYELDHCIPLCLDGSNDRSNLQLQPWPEARLKDADEINLCRGVSNGTYTKPQAILIMQQKWGCRAEPRPKEE